MTLNQLKNGQTGQIIGLSGDAHDTERLLELGLVPGREVHFIRRAPLAGPYIVQIAKSVLALRKEEAQCVLIQALP